MWSNERAACVDRPRRLGALWLGPTVWVLVNLSVLFALYAVMAGFHCLAGPILMLAGSAYLASEGARTAGRGTGLSAREIDVRAGALVACLLAFYLLWAFGSMYGKPMLGTEGGPRAFPAFWTGPEGVAAGLYMALRRSALARPSAQPWGWLAGVAGGLTQLGAMALKEALFFARALAPAWVCWALVCSAVAGMIAARTCAYASRAAKDTSREA
jgi:hypothetical protein